MCRDAAKLTSAPPCVIKASTTRRMSADSCAWPPHHPSVRDHHMQGRVSLARPFLNDSVDVATAAPEDSDEIFDLHGIQPTMREALVTEVLGHEMQHRPAGGVAPDCPLLGHDDGMRHAANLLQEIYLRLENRRRILRLLLCSGRSDQTAAPIQHICNETTSSEQLRSFA